MTRSDSFLLLLVALAIMVIGGGIWEAAIYGGYGLSPVLRVGFIAVALVLFFMGGALTSIAVKGVKWTSK